MKIRILLACLPVLGAQTSQTRELINNVAAPSFRHDDDLVALPQSVVAFSARLHPSQEVTWARIAAPVTPTRSVEGQQGALRMITTVT